MDGRRNTEDVAVSALVRVRALQSVSVAVDKEVSDGESEALDRGLVRLTAVVDWGIDLVDDVRLNCR